MYGSEPQDIYFREIDSTLDISHVYRVMYLDSLLFLTMCMCLCSKAEVFLAVIARFKTISLLKFTFC